MVASIAIIGCLAAVGIAFVVKTYVASAYAIPSEAMSPTLVVGDRILVDKALDVEQLPRGAVIVFKRPADESSAGPEFVKRIIGLPGESIAIAEGRVLVDGRDLDEPWLPAGVRTDPRSGSGSGGQACTTADPCVVPAGHVWVLGDNRQTSEDSRYFGPVDKLIVGRATEIVWPRSRAGAIT